MKPNISIIIPAYNVAAYLDACLESVLAQEFLNEQYEVIVVDDGSTDDTSIIADSWSKRMPNIKVVHQPNQGLSMARNNGLQQAQGQYVLFLDADDTLRPRSLTRPLSLAMRNELDVLRFQYGVYDESGKKKQASRTWGPRETMLDGKEYLSYQKVFRAYVWTYLIRRTLIMNEVCPLWFEKGVYYEDVRWTPIMLWYTQRMMICDEEVYQYKLRDGSITHVQTLEQAQINIEHQFLTLERLQQLKKEYNSWTLFNRQIWNMCESIITTIAKRDYANRYNYLKRLEPMMQTTPYDAHLFGWVDRMKIGIIRLSAILYCRLRHYC